MKNLLLLFCLLPLSLQAQTFEEVLSAWINGAPKGFYEAFNNYGKDGAKHFVEIESISSIYGTFYAEIVLSENKYWLNDYKSALKSLDKILLFKNSGWVISEWEDGNGEKYSKGKNYEFYQGAELTHFVSLFYGANFTGERKVLGMNISAKSKVESTDVPNLELKTK